MKELLILGSAILIGFIGHALFRYTKVPESLFMIIIGLIVGPFSNVVNPSEFISFTPLIITLTLIIVLLDSGLSLSIMDVSRVLGKTLVFTFLVLISSTLSIGSLMFILGWELLPALLIGVVSSGTTTIIVTSLITRLSISDEIKQILVLESIINDVTLVTAAVLLIQLMQLGSVDTQQVISALVRPILVAILLGGTFAVVWVNVVWWFSKDTELLYVFTIGMLFILHYVTGIMQGNEAIGILVLSLTLGNASLLCDKVGKSRLFQNYPPSLKTLAIRTAEVVAEIKKTQVNFAFIIKNFFFVYLGIIFDPTQLNPISIGITVLILLLMFVSRYFSARIMGILDWNFRKFAIIISSMVARGFTATFVALLPATMGVDIPRLKEIILLMVLFSTVPTIVGAIIFERRKIPVG
jgi:NhaP-type Na+/H+ or K+/H+ antiporter